ncbi:unnamed protein product [Dibothriocephalus latus]|uniref:Vps72/YL1 C-terminal domain-containing protein n=1 Tax=Dibothriocephalus latus TaxID=60516 RepID=A0A3P7LI05_DIBLA|nr:unnamed protein product [Dibothriocephalus latus]
MEASHPFKRIAEKPVGKKPPARSYRQLVNSDYQYQWPEGTVLYQQLEAPPSLRPQLKVSDLTGIPTSLKDPRTTLRYVSVEEYRRIKDLPQDIVKGYLYIRNAATNNII